MTVEQWKQRMSNLSPENQTKLSVEQQKYTDATTYPEALSDKMLLYRQFVLTHANEMQLGIDIGYWERLLRGDIKEYTLTDITTLLTACQGRTLREWINWHPYAPADMGFAPANDWVAFRKWVAEAEEVMNPVIETKFNALYQKYMTMKHLDVTGQSKSIPLAHKNPVVQAHEKKHGPIVR